MKGISLLQGEIIVKEYKYTANLLQNLKVKFNQTGYKLSLVDGYSILFK
jgi:hypothetical protein